MIIALTIIIFLLLLILNLAAHNHKKQKAENIGLLKGRSALLDQYDALKKQHEKLASQHDALMLKFDMLVDEEIKFKLNDNKFKDEISNPYERDTITIGEGKFSASLTQANVSTFNPITGVIKAAASVNGKIENVTIKVSE